VSGDPKGISDIQKDSSQEAQERTDATEAGQEHQVQSGQTPDTQEQFDQARQDADWDIVQDHIDHGGKIDQGLRLA
jgi:hypothetical protein